MEPDCGVDADEKTWSWEARCGTAVKMVLVEEMVCLGVLLTRDGCSRASFAHRRAIADRLLWKTCGELLDRKAPLAERLRAFFATCAAALLWGTRRLAMSRLSARIEVP